MSVNERLAALTCAGTSVWLDEIQRGLIERGELQRLVEGWSLRGVTSNPAIFEKAILGSSDYDAQIAELARRGATALEVLHAIAIRDVGAAADVLASVHDATGGADGFVSLEVDPDLAHDPERTLAQAREFWAALGRPNVMIKIPGTDACVPAIEQATYEGININVTLLFSVAAYERVAEAYIRGLERRHAAGRTLDVHSVASFFVSRVDTEVDQRLAALDRSDLRGRAGLANARAAYRRFKEIFGGERFAALRASGAPVQRPLWASTGVKDPVYPDTLYVDGLVAPDTVNTMPMPTLLAAAEHTAVGGPTADADPDEDLRALAQAGIDLDDVTGALLRAGIAKFVEPAEKLLASIEAKRVAVVTERPAAIDASLPGALEPAVAARLRQAVEAGIAGRIADRDDTLWGPPGQPEVVDRLGWLELAADAREQIAGIGGFVRRCRKEGLTDAVLLGMGGSSLAPEVLRRSFGPADGGLRLHVLDSTDPRAIAEVEARIDPATTLFVVATKSGTTIETLTAFEHFHALQPDGGHWVAITDPGSPLVQLAVEEGFRRTYLNDPDIGGRYSALSLFGLVPAGLMGLDVGALLEGGRAAAEACAARDGGAVTAVWLGATLGELALRGRDKLTLVLAPPIASLGLWLEQLVAESTGKHGRGLLPVVEDALGPPEAYGDDRVFLTLRLEGDRDTERDERLAALARAGHPVVALDVAAGPAGLGAAFFVAEFATAVAGWALGINPFDQPDVQEAKDTTGRVLEGGAADPEDASDDALRVLLAGAAPPHYVAILGYTAPHVAFDEAAAELCAAIRRATRAATTFGYGPRYLHSTGQYHKGGPPLGRFLQVVHDARPDVEIPGRRYTFEVLKRAQATGDLLTLRGRGLPAERVTLRGEDPAAALRALTARIEGLL